MRARVCLFWLILGYLAAPAQAQLDPAAARATLRGVPAFYVLVDVERSGTLAAADSLFDIAPAVISGLLEGGLSIAMESAGLPYLYLHVNALDAGEGLVPFAIDYQFRQPATLDRDRSIQAKASTWETGAVGVVSTDNLGMIRDATLDLLGEFIEDFHSENPAGQ